MQIYMPALSGRRLRILDNPHDHHKIQRQNDDYANKTMLLGKGREDEILVRNGQKAKLRLGSLGDSLAEHPAGARRRSCDWINWYPVPCGSRSGSRKLTNRAF